ncbi:hypothetical protein FRX31_028418 [Thalictrum thalictroides]|uniref:Uncharacterized protein n=1 Tax=Thalictrum thalictroides TaxID=46969 RepID=A0A7J6VCR3_THATH|nr:hypothetical protein FRX31_028418 [Thalictrum thalictroides]
MVKQHKHDLLLEGDDHGPLVSVVYGDTHSKLLVDELDLPIPGDHYLCHFSVIWAIKSEEIHCIQVHDVREEVHELTSNNSFACFASQATGVRVFSLAMGVVNGALPAGQDIYCIVVNNDFVFPGTKCGTIDVCLRERLIRVSSLRISGAGNTRVTSLISDSDGDMLFAGSSDGKIQV